MHIYKISDPILKISGAGDFSPLFKFRRYADVSFAAHEETIDLTMQNWINLVALLLCDNDLIKRAVSARVKFTESGAR